MTFLSVLALVVLAPGAGAVSEGDVNDGDIAAAKEQISQVLLEARSMDAVAIDQALQNYDLKNGEVISVPYDADVETERQ